MPTLTARETHPHRPAAAPAHPLPSPAQPEHLLDMVHHNPGEPECVSAYTSPSTLAALGYGGRVFMIFESAQLAVDWSDVDPGIFPEGSEAAAWVERKREELLRKYREAREAGLRVYCQCDMVLFPRGLVERAGLEHFGDVRDERTRHYLTILLRKMFREFPDLDGIVVRVGETYLHDAPHHVGHIREKGNPRETIIPLMNLLREVVCEELDKEVFFRTWLSFDRPTSENYQLISAAVEPHRNLIISDKHCEDDFHRGNRFSRFLGLGRHRQIVEIQCQREYEGKGAYPHYVAHGIIEGFEEYRHIMEPGEMRSLREFVRHPLYAGAWTWSRGGGWQGPYIANELWIDLNTHVLSTWLQSPGESEEAVFARYARERLGLSGEDAARFRELCLLSADAVVRGKRGTHADIEGWWCRDHFLGTPPLPDSPAAVARVLAEKHEAAAIWQEIARLVREIRFPDPETAVFATVSCDYGRILYTIIRTGFDLAAIRQGYGNTVAIPALIAEYDALWREWRELQESQPLCPTLYKDHGFMALPECGGIGQFVDSFRQDG
ncbi:hypothetical protein DB345_02185 [Spartobacteria bacterium LR76]|nr:hypothetical protein DB345_02185 [Spartobacteria bacterium LR76]